MRIFAIWIFTLMSAKTAMAQNCRDGRCEWQPRQVVASVGKVIETVLPPYGQPIIAPQLSAHVSIIESAPVVSQHNSRYDVALPQCNCGCGVAGCACGLKQVQHHSERHCRLLPRVHHVSAAMRSGLRRVVRKCR